MFTGLRHH
ncbi:hypothetical protein YPPY29_4432, partial [Yersinia pestis PY-29]